MSGGETITNSGRYANLGKLTIVLLALLLTLDIVLICLHVLWFDYHWVWDLESETGYPESFQYLKWGAAAGLLLFLAWKRSALSYAIWAVLFLYLLLDDSQYIHERVARWLVEVLDLKAFEEIYHRNFEYFFLKAQDFGELLFALTIGTVVVITLFVFRPAREATRERTVTKWLLCWILLFAFFAVGIDMLHVMAWEIYPPAIELLTVVEEGGEMISASLLVAGLTWELGRT